MLSPRIIEVALDAPDHVRLDNWDDEIVPDEQLMFGARSRMDRFGNAAFRASRALARDYGIPKADALRVCNAVREERGLKPVTEE